MLPCCLFQSEGRFLKKLFLPAVKEAAAGAVDEEDFIKSFEDVSSVQVCSGGYTCAERVKHDCLSLFILFTSWSFFLCRSTPTESWRTS